MHPKRLAFIAAMGLLTVPSVAQAYTIKGYGVRDAGDRIVHRLTICWPPSDRLHRFEVAARSELLDGGDKRIRYGSVYARGCERWHQLPRQPASRGNLLRPDQGASRTNRLDPVHPLASVPITMRLGLLVVFVLVGLALGAQIVRGRQ